MRPMGAAPMAPTPFGAQPHAAQGKSKVLRFVIAFIAFDIVMAGIIFAVVYSGSSSGSSISGPADGRGSPESVAAAKRKKARAKEKAGVSIKATKGSKVELSSLMKQANRVARKEHKKAVLVSVHFSKVRNGMIDLSKDGEGHFMYEYEEKDSSKPPGQDLSHGSFHVLMRNKGLRVWAHTKHKGKSRRLEDAVPMPKCASDRLWQGAVKSGVPGNAVATIHLYKRGHRTGKLQWSIRVEGHDEYRREFDALSCKLLRNWGKRR